MEMPEWMDISVMLPPLLPQSTKAYVRIYVVLHGSYYIQTVATLMFYWTKIIVDLALSFYVYSSKKECKISEMFWKKNKALLNFDFFPLQSEILPIYSPMFLKDKIQFEFYSRFFPDFSTAFRKISIRDKCLLHMAGPHFKHSSN